MRAKPTASECIGLPLRTVSAQVARDRVFSVWSRDTCLVQFRVRRSPYGYWLLGATVYLRSTLVRLASERFALTPTIDHRSTLVSERPRPENKPGPMTYDWDPIRKNASCKVRPPVSLFLVVLVPSREAWSAPLFGRLDRPAHLEATPERFAVFAVQYRVVLALYIPAAAVAGR
ncbi:hypothetical protein BD309DRAFT_964724 [Dichomitus squalens]|uniref:Uncharacterized protein n=1 Tax=Dichomitus squalens TaxID=114155 RepID=A0A4Q9QC84_9APHY|nr:hypothetical protein BD309DRAFT_964724 [Dichomitus squalens]TBU64294.1 hypothetical protein BD310DRAFT_391837 [Dichomitus squalens]